MLVSIHCLVLRSLKLAVRAMISVVHVMGVTEAESVLVGKFGLLGDKEAGDIIGQIVIGNEVDFILRKILNFIVIDVFMPFSVV